MVPVVGELSRGAAMIHGEGIHWTNKSVLDLAKGENPVTVVEQKARDLVLLAKDDGWMGPPFNPIVIAKLLGVHVKATADVVDARTIVTNEGPRIEFNPTQARERVRFSIAHELAHLLFPDVADQVRHRGGNPDTSDDWQLEALCNIAASEFVMPLGTLPIHGRIPPIENLMVARRNFDVSAEAFLIRVVKTASEPIVMFCASSKLVDGYRRYHIDYTVNSISSPKFRLTGRQVPENTVIYSCNAIGHTDKADEDWLSGDRLRIECVGIPGYPGSSYPRVAGLIHFAADQTVADVIKSVHGDVLEPRDKGVRIICQLVNDQARSWGGGLARSTAKRFPLAQREFSSWISAITRSQRLGQVHFAQVNDSVYVASLIAQHGFGASTDPRIRYTALKRCLEAVSSFAGSVGASVHMPRIGTGQSGGEWNTVEELVRTILIKDNVSVTVYDLPPRRKQAELF